MLSLASQVMIIFLFHLTVYCIYPVVQAAILDSNGSSLFAATASAFYIILSSVCACLAKSTQKLEPAKDEESNDEGAAKIWRCAQIGSFVFSLFVMLNACLNITCCLGKLCGWTWSTAFRSAPTGVGGAFVHLVMFCVYAYMTFVLYRHARLCGQNRCQCWRRHEVPPAPWKRTRMCLSCNCLFTVLLGAAAIAVFLRYPFLHARSTDTIADSQPGNLVRLNVQADIITALKTKNWATVEQRVAELSFLNFALVVGESSGLLWESEHGWTSLDHHMAIWRLMSRDRQKLSPDTKVSKYITSWPSEDHQIGSNVTLGHLLAFTTGFAPLEGYGCTRPFPGQSQAQSSCAQCIEEICSYEFMYQPGETWQYGPWHMVIAAAMAQKAFGKELTMEAWVKTVKEEIFEPAGLTENPNYAGTYSDLPFGLQPASTFPDFAGGLRMTGRQLQKIIQTLQFGGMLTKTDFDAFIQDRTKNVKYTVSKERIVPWGGETDISRAGYLLGMWHYAQGQWIACDEAALEVM